MMEKQLIPAGYKQTEAGLIPSDWQDTVIGGVAEFVGGSQPPKSTFKSIESLGYIRLIQIRDYKKDTYITYIPEHLAQKKCNSDDIMIGRYGPPIFQILRGIQGAYNVALIKVIPNEKIVREFLFYTLKSEKLFQVMEILSQRSSGQTGVDLPALKSYPLALPSKEEQTAIANALSDVDALIAALEKLINKKGAIKTAAMQQLLTGKKRLPPFDQLNTGYKQTELGEIPADWEVNELKNYCASFKTGKLDANAMTTDGEYRFYTCAKNFSWIDHYAFNTEALLVSGNGANVGYVHYYSGKFNAYQRTYVLSDFSADILYLKVYLEQKLADRIRVEVNSGNTPYITMDTLTDMSILIPTEKAEQTAIANVLSDMDKDLESLQQRLHKTQQIKQGMMQELLTGKTRLVSAKAIGVSV